MMKLAFLENRGLPLNCTPDTKCAVKKSERERERPPRVKGEILLGRKSSQNNDGVSNHDV